MGGNYYGQETLVGTGRVAGNDPWRVVVKRAILTGIPTKVQKKKASVRSMFYSPDDVRYFKPVDLFTKHGKHGSIKEPVGTHGAMKCRFNAPVHQHDTVCLALYKRIFPPYPVQISQ
jgi:pre-rRNA-processing protein TSR1